MACQQIIEVQCNPATSVLTSGAIGGDGQSVATALTFLPDQLSVTETDALATKICGTVTALATLRNCIQVNTSFVTIAGNAAVGLSTPNSPPAGPVENDLHFELYDDSEVTFKYNGATWDVVETLDLAGSTSAIVDNGDGTYTHTDGAVSAATQNIVTVSGDANNGITVGTDNGPFISNVFFVGASTTSNPNANGYTIWFQDDTGFILVFDGANWVVPRAVV